MLKKLGPSFLNLHTTTVGREKEYNLKSSASRKIILSGKLNAKTTPPRCSEVSEQPDIIDYIDNYFLMEKLAFFLMPKSWCTNFLGQYFLCQFPKKLFDNNKILITMKEDLVLNLNTFQYIL